jgi:NADP-dependent 3-hydroxy acid dehydrogenase YdfG
LTSELGDEQTLATPTVVTDPSACAELVDRTLDHFGSLDVLIHNAGLGLYAPITEVDPEDWRTMFDVKASGIPDSCKPGNHQQAGEVMETCSE